jgi:uncharacterized cofD-like protein
MEHRFADGDVQGHAFGNLMIVAMAETEGDLVAALDHIGALLDVVGRVLPATTQTVHLHAVSVGGEQVEGQVAVGSRPDLCSVRLDPPDATATPEAVEAIVTADQIVLGPGSLYTSVLAATAVPGIAAALADSPAQLVYACNLRPQESETLGYDVAAHVDTLRRHGITPDVVLYDPHTIGDAPGVGSAVPAALARTSGLAHDPELLGKALADLLDR